MEQKTQKNLEILDHSFAYRKNELALNELQFSAILLWTVELLPAEIDRAESFTARRGLLKL